MIHNYLLSLYADLQGHEKILSFLAQEPRHYDLRYALRTCMRAGKQKACIHIYNYMGKYEEAVELSLEIGDLALAKANADAAASLPEPPGKEEDYYGAHELEAAGFGAPFGQEPNQERRKKLWLRIAQHVFAETQDPSLMAAASRRTVAGIPVGERGVGGEEDDEGEGAGEAERHRIVAGEDGKAAPEESQGVQGVEGGTEAVPAPGGGGEGPEEAGPGDDEGGEEGISVARLQRNIREAVQFVRQCEMIKIEDILPFFPEGTRLDDFQEEICVSLEDYNRDIEVLKSTMDEVTPRLFQSMPLWSLNTSIFVAEMSLPRASTVPCEANPAHPFPLYRRLVRPRTSRTTFESCETASVSLQRISCATFVVSLC